jgi:hypothetical protein
LVRNGNVRIPVSLDLTTAQMIVHLALVSEYPGPVVLHPWEGETTRSLLEAFGWRGRAFPLPEAPVRLALRFALSATSRLPALYSKLRLLEMMLVGQGQQSARARECGFQLPQGLHEAYVHLAAEP